MRFNASSIDSFICYYLHIGFCTLFIYADDPSDPIVEIAQRYPTPRVILIPCDSKLKQEWEALPSWNRLGMYASTEVQARQQLNCEHCMDQCRAARLDWLLHVDSDELLWLPEVCKSKGSTGRCESSALQRHLQHLDRVGALIFTYRNLEAVPEKLECADSFLEVSLFKQHPTQLDGRSAAVNAAIQYWLTAEGAGSEYFRFYANGKSIVRVHDAIRVCGSVHEWEMAEKRFISTSGFTNNPLLLHSQYIPHQRMRVDEVGGAVILHFPVSSFSRFWQKRWAALGYASPNHRFRGSGGGLDQRANALALLGRKREAEALYRRSMMIDSAEQLARQLDAGVCLRLDALGAVVRRARSLWLCGNGAVNLATNDSHQAGLAEHGMNAPVSSPGHALGSDVETKARRMIEGMVRQVVVASESEVGMSEAAAQALQESVLEARALALELCGISATASGVQSDPVAK